MQVETTSRSWARFCEQVEAFLRADIIHLNLDGRPVSGFRSPDSPALWIRDHSDILRGGVYVERDVKSAVEAFAETQSANGRVFDWAMSRAGTPPCERENWEKWVRVPVEADVEYRFVKAAYLAWQATGDDTWIASLLPSLDRALSYTRTHPQRWDPTHGLVKRPYTIDTWDFDYTAGRNPWLNFEITDHTFWGITHGDNSGFYESAMLLAQLYERAGDAMKATVWRSEAEAVRDRANALLFNGRFYTHFHKLTPVEIEGVDEAEQLSLSSPMAINRGMATHEIAVAMLEEYRARRAKTGAFAEWFSIDPPFPDGLFGDEKLVGGAYVNGGILPLVGGELALAALEHGYERYGVETLRQYAKMVEETGETYLWYFPDGRASTVDTSTSPEAMPTDGWGSSAMLHAFVTGLAGIRDEGALYRNVRLAPRWVASNETHAHVEVAYAASGATFGYEYQHRPDQHTVVLQLKAAESDVALHLLLPEGARATAVRWDGHEAAFENVAVEASSYVDAQGHVTGQAVVEVTYERA